MEYSDKEMQGFDVLIILLNFNNCVDDNKQWLGDGTEMSATFDAMCAKALQSPRPIILWASNRR